MELRRVVYRSGDLTVTSFNLNGATLQDAASNSANLSGAVTNPAGTLQIDTAAPAVASEEPSPPLPYPLATGYLLPRQNNTLTAHPTAPSPAPPLPPPPPLHHRP